MNNTPLPLGAGLYAGFTTGGIEVTDHAKTNLEEGGGAFARVEGTLPDRRPRHVFAVARLIAGDGPVVVTPARRSAAAPTADTSTGSGDVGEARLEALVRLPDGRTEEWLVESDPANSRFTWTRRSSGPLGRLVLVVPRQDRTLEYWQTGSGSEIMNEAIPNAHDAERQELVAPGERELLCYTVHPRTTFLARTEEPADIAIRKTFELRDPYVGEWPWEVGPDGKWRDDVWEASWSGASRVTFSWGIVAATRDFSGRLAAPPADAGRDFGPFYHQMYLGCLPLNLRVYGKGHVAPAANVIFEKDAHHYRLTWSRDNVFAYEFLHLANPDAVAELAAHYLDYRFDPETGFTGSADDAEAEVLVLAGRHFLLTGDVAYHRARIERYRAVGEYLVSLRPPGENLPLTFGSWDGQGGPCKGKEPYFLSILQLGFDRLAMIERAVGDEASAGRWEAEAASVRMEALKDYRDGGLWHSGRGTFINYTDYRDLSEYGPREQLCLPGDRRRRDTGIPRTEFAHYQTIIPIFLGLLTEEKTIRDAFAWIDSTYDYASGHGGVTLPPYVVQNFMLLADVAVRLRYGIPGADRLLQLVLDRALDSGLPMCEWALGAYGGGGPIRYPKSVHYRQTHTGRIWENSPYFGIVLGLHYGLSYTWRGWRIEDPKPLANYPLTSLSGLRRKDATFELRWEGEGAVRRVTVDGRESESRLLDETSGAHEVVVTLGR